MKIGNALSLASVIFASLLVGGCSSVSKTVADVSKSSQIAPFSTLQLGEPHPLSWQPWIISRFNRRTDYRVVEFEGQRVLMAHSDKAASGLLQDVAIDPTESPNLSWRWHVKQILPGADLNRRGSDDSPVRVIVSFDGDHDKLDVEDRATARLVKLFSGRDMPYATLMYVWDNKLPVGTMLDNAHSGRAKMIVVESGGSRTGQWLNFTRNVVNDFKRAFGEYPGRVISVGVMTDSNTTESEATAHYGDIVLQERP